MRLRKTWLSLSTGLCLIGTLAWAGYNETPPVPSATVIGGVKSIAASANKWIDSISTAGVPNQTQPDFSNLSGSAACAQLPALTGNVTSSACATTVATVPAGATVNDVIRNANYKIVTSQLSKSTDAALANITGLSYTLVAGKTYICHGQLPITSGASGGAKVALTGDGTLSVTSMNMTATFSAAAAGTGAVKVTALASAAGITAVHANIILDAVLVVNAGGVMTVQGAQNASNGTATVFLVNGSFNCDRIT